MGVCYCSSMDREKNDTPITDARRDLEASLVVLADEQAVHVVDSARAERSAKRVQAQENVVRAKQEWLQLLENEAGAVGGDRPQTPVAPIDDSNGRGIIRARPRSRNESVLEILANASQPLSGREIQRRLEDAGALEGVLRPNHSIHRSLGDLVRNGSAKRVNKGLYSTRGDQGVAEDLTRSSEGAGPADDQQRFDVTPQYLSGPEAILRVLRAANRPLTRREVLLSVQRLGLLSPAYKDPESGVKVGLKRLQDRGEVLKTSDGRFQRAVAVPGG